MTFNPEDFVFENIILPEEDPTLIEYDANAGFIIVRTVDQYGSYAHQSCNLARSINETLLENLPDKFSSRNDKIVQFFIRESGKYGLIKSKLKYNYTTKESTWITYDYKGLTLEEGRELYEAIKAAVWVQQFTEQQESVDDTLELAKKDVYLLRMYQEDLRKQDALLRSSDWRILDDAPVTFDNEKQYWIKWRAELRDLVKHPDEFDTEFDYLVYKEELTWPVNPEQYHSIDPQHEEEYLTSDKHFTKSTKDLSVTQNSLDKINAYVNSLVSYVKDREENGVPINQRLYKVLSRYNLLHGLDEVSFTVEEDS